MKETLLALSLGEFLEDQYRSGKRQVGGAPANVAFRFQALGGKCLLVSRVGNDSLGQALLAHLRAHGLDTRFVQIDQSRPTGTVTVFDDTPSEQTSYEIHSGAWDAIELEDEAERAAAAAHLIFFSSLGQRSDISAVTIRRLVRAGKLAKKVFDVNLRPPHISPPALNFGFEHSWLIKFSDDEMERLGTHLKTAPSPDTIAASLFQNFGASYVVATFGSGGSIGFQRDEQRIVVPGYPIKFVDAVGAGDSFLAACAYALAQGESLECALDYGNRLGALVASKAGGMPVVTPEEVKALSRAQ